MKKFDRVTSILIYLQTKSVITAGELATRFDVSERTIYRDLRSLENAYATDVDAALKNFDVLGTRLGPLGVSPPMTMLGVTRLAIPGLMFELEATAND